MKRSQTTNLILTILLLFVILDFGVSVFACPQLADRVNINTASAEELQLLPGIGPKLAARIIERRQKHGLFKRPQDIIIVRGFSAKRFRQIAHLIAANPSAAEAPR